VGRGLNNAVVAEHKMTTADAGVSDRCIVTVDVRLITPYLDAIQHSDVDESQQQQQ